METPREERKIIVGQLSIYHVEGCVYVQRERPQYMTCQIAIDLASYIQYDSYHFQILTLSDWSEIHERY